MNYAYIPDPNFRAALNAKLKQVDDAEITIEQLNGLQWGHFSEQGIKCITGAEHLINITELNLSNNEIIDLTPLFNLKNLRYLDLSNNQIYSIILLANLINLAILLLYNNPITDLTPLRSLTKLNRLYVDHISEITPRYYLIDVTPLSELTNLRALHLYTEKITSVDLTHFDVLLPLQSITLHKKS